MKGWNAEAVKDVVKRLEKAGSAHSPTPLTPQQKTFALGRLKGREMNKTEHAYSKLLEVRKNIGEVKYWSFEPQKLRLANNTWYTPDFLIMLADGRLQCHEVKGFWMDDARVKIKACADLFPFEFVAVRLLKGVWTYEYF